MLPSDRSLLRDAVISSIASSFRYPRSAGYVESRSIKLSFESILNLFLTEILRFYYYFIVILFFVNLLISNINYKKQSISVN